MKMKGGELQRALLLVLEQRRQKCRTAEVIIESCTGPFLCSLLSPCASIAAVVTHAQQPRKTPRITFSRLSRSFDLLSHYRFNPQACAGPQDKGAQESKLKLSKEEEALFDDDDLEDDELEELEAKLESTHVD